MGLITALAVALAVAVGIIVLLAILLATRSNGSEYLTVDRDVSGQLTMVNSGGTAIAMDTDDGQLATRVVNPDDFTFERGDTVIGTLVQTPVEGGGSADGLLIYQVS